MSTLVNTLIGMDCGFSLHGLDTQFEMSVSDLTCLDSYSHDREKEL